MDDAIFMLNALWFKEDGGHEKYLEYGAAVAPLLQKVGAEVKDNFRPDACFIGEWDPDVFFMVKYPSKAAFESMVSSQAYQDIAHLREQSIEKSLLVACKPVDLGVAL